MVEGGTGGARVAETRSKRAGWRTLGVQNALSMDTGRAGARGRSHNCLFVSDFVARLAHRLTGFSSMDTAKRTALTGFVSGPCAEITQIRVQDMLGVRNNSNMAQSP